MASRKLIVWTLGNAGHPSLVCGTSFHHPSLNVKVLTASSPYTLHVKHKILEGLSSILEGVEESDIVAFHDGHDATLWCNEDELLSIFDSFDCDILLGGEAFLYPALGYDPGGSDRFRFFNSGAYMGKAWALRKFVDYCRALPEARLGCDQGAFHEYVKSGRALSDKVRVQVDRKERLMSNMAHAQECAPDFLEYDGGDRVKGVNKCTGHPTCGIHFNGLPNEEFEKTCRQLRRSLKPEPKMRHYQIVWVIAVLGALFFICAMLMKVPRAPRQAT